MTDGSDVMAGTERWWRVTRPSDGHVTWTPDDPSDRLFAAWDGAKVEGPFVPEAEVERLQQVITDAYHLMNLGRYDRAKSELANAVNLFGRHLRDVLASDSPALPEERPEECFACHGTGEFAPCADEPLSRPTLKCAECDGTGHLASSSDTPALPEER